MHKLKIVFTILTLFVLIPSFVVYAAITYDADTQSADAVNASSLTFNHTTAAGDNRILFVAIQCDDNDIGSYSASSVTYNGVALTLAQISAEYGVNTTEVWYLVNPATGTNEVSISDAQSFLCDRLRATAITYQGVDQSTPIDVSVENGNATASDPSTNITTTVANTWILDSTVNGTGFAGTVTVGANQTERWQNTVNSADHYGSDEIAASIGTYTMSWSLETDRPWATVAVAFREAATTDPSPTGKFIFNNDKVYVKRGTLKIK